MFTLSLAFKDRRNDLSASEKNLIQSKQLMGREAKGQLSLAVISRRGSHKISASR